jgi:uncharacterized protein (DUF58 family)
MTRPPGWQTFLARLRRLPLRLRKVLRGGTEGLHPSKLRGAGLSFVENRPYVPGDDPRAINWPLTARTGEPIVKRFEASRELILWLVVDPSPSMFLGDPVSPIRWALEICGAAQAATSAGKDRLGLLVPGDERSLPLRIAPRRGRVPGLHLLEALAGLGPAIPSNGAGLQGLAELIKPIAARHQVVWFRPELPHLKHLPNWPDPGFPATVERHTWNIMEDPVTRLGIWMKGTGA